MATDAVSKYRYWCVTEEIWVYWWRTEAEGVPTQCPNNTAHTIDTATMSIVETVESQDVHITEVDVNLPTTDVAFPDRAGYNIYYPGYRRVATKGTVTNFDITYSVDFKLQGMLFKIGDMAVDGDNLSVQVVDVDGIVYPAGTVLVTFADEMQAWPGREFKVQCEDVKTLYSWSYMRFIYDSIGAANDVVIYFEHYLRTIPV